MYIVTHDVFYTFVIYWLKNGFFIIYSFIRLAIFFLIAGPQVVENLFLEVIRAFYSYCRDALGSDLKLSYTQSGNSVIR